MANINEVYQTLTGVDIQEQYRLWDERGKGYYGEYLVFKRLYPELTGCCKILMNLHIPTAGKQTTEIDLLLIHETGLYVFEVKHYKGTIYGKSSDQKWTQYFRTTTNSYFYNPILQNQYHIQALRNMFPDIPVRSFVVFTSDECDLRITCNEPNITVCRLQNLRSSLSLLTTEKMVMDIDHINALFDQLIVYSPATQKSVIVDGDPIALHDYINTIANDFREAKTYLFDDHITFQKVERRKTATAIISAIIAICISIAVSIFSCYSYRLYADEKISAAETTLQEFAQKFEHIAPYNNGLFTLHDSFLNASTVQISNSKDTQNTIVLQFTLNWNGEKYGANISRETKIIVILKDGSVKEYSLNESTFPSKSSDLKLGHGNAWYAAYSAYEFPLHELFGVNIDDIDYIKLSSIDIWTTEDGKLQPIIVGTGYEVQIYPAS